MGKRFMYIPNPLGTMEIEPRKIPSPIHEIIRSLRIRNQNSYPNGEKKMHRIQNYSNLISTIMISDFPAVFTGGPHNRKPLVTKKWVLFIFLCPQLNSYKR